MKIVRLFASFALVLALTAPSQAQSGDGVLIRCGASKGYGYFLKNELTNPNGPSWQEDGFSTGKIVLVRLGSEWDIQFSDTVGESGYRQQGASVVPLMRNDHLLTMGVFHENYSDIYTFDFRHREVVWTSNRHYPINKVAVYRADCR